MKIIQIEISKLIPDPANVRRHGQKNLDAIKGSLSRFGQQKPIVVTEKNVVIAGNGTLEAARALGWQSLDCVVTSLSGSNLIAFGLADNRTAELAEWDTKSLGVLLDSLQKEDFNLDEIGFDQENIDILINDTDEDSEETQYSTKIEPPIYSPRGKKPKISEIYNREKTKKLLSAIDHANIDSETKKFLQHAAERHTVFNFELVAEFYAHASKEIQELMEDSALVVIDINKAIENGFVRMTADLADLAHEQ